jgi:hypothetical protein
VVLFIITQQQQPAFIMQLRQSQQACIISQHLLSPLVQVMQTPFSVVSQRHSPIIRLQQQTILPFIIMQQLTRPLCIMVQRFCIMLHAILSSQEHIMRIPPWHFSNFSVQRGTIIQLAGMVAEPPIMVEPIQAAPMPVIEARSIIMLAISQLLCLKNHTAVSPNGDNRDDLAELTDDKIMGRSLRGNQLTRVSRGEEPTSLSNPYLEGKLNEETSWREVPARIVLVKSAE